MWVKSEVRPAHKGQQDRPEQQDRPVRLAPLGLPGLKVLLGPLAPKVIPVQQDLRAHKVQPDLLAQPDLKAQPVKV